MGVLRVAALPPPVSTGSGSKGFISTSRRLLVKGESFHRCRGAPGGSCMLGEPTRSGQYPSLLAVTAGEEQLRVPPFQQVPMLLKRTMVLALTLAGCGGDSGGTGPDAPPASVSNVVGQVVGGEVRLSWTSAQRASSYRIYMASQSGVTRVNHTTLPGNMFHPDLQLSFDHPAGLDVSTAYFFVVTAFNANGESTESCEISVTIAGALGGSC
jgi:hypothetical protein